MVAIPMLADALERQSTAAPRPTPSAFAQSSRVWMGVGLFFGVFAVFIFAMVVVLHFLRRRTLRARNDPAFSLRNAPPPFERAVPQPPTVARLQRRWASRSGITIEELDSVAPIRSFAPHKRHAFNNQKETPSEVPVNVQVNAMTEAVATDNANADNASESQESGSDALETTCAICLEEMEVGAKTRRLPCGHEFDARYVFVFVWFASFPFAMQALSTQAVHRAPCLA